MCPTDVPGPTPVVSRVLPIDRLRAFLTALVVTHHAVLAYHPYAPKPPAALNDGSMIWGAFPIVDQMRMPGADLLVGFNDSFFMALMFLLAGLFVPGGIARHGGGRYLRERALRLGAPFVVAAGVLAPLAYAATYAQVTASPTLSGFASQWLALGVWPAGPAWFLWVLFVFGALAALLSRFAPGWANASARLLCGDSARPARALWVLVAASALVYVPTAMLLDPTRWASFGPFFVQTARIPLYFLYFVTGAAIGTMQMDRHLLSADGKLARRWFLWANLAPLAFFFLVAAFLMMLDASRKGEAPWLLVLTHFAFVLSCATTSFALLAYFSRKMHQPSRLWNSLAENAFGIYLLHYPIVAWLQYALLDVSLPGYAKAAIVIIAGLGISWLVAIALRQFAWVERVIGRGASKSLHRI
ncbi:MAG: acyltransferase [Lysobacteraceae bacterium]|nr:MAG: acyltransferase [Xanthomonadaceae bacterium]